VRTVRRQYPTHHRLSSLLVACPLLPPEIIIFRTLLNVVVPVAAGWKPTRKQSWLTALD
jgi:hypothetical protein